MTAVEFSAVHKEVYRSTDNHCAAHNILFSSGFAIIISAEVAPRSQGRDEAQYMN
jgi:hypothetical protein